MRKQTRPQRPMSEVQIRTRFEEIEAAVLQSTNVSELYQALDALLDDEHWTKQDLRSVLELAGPEKVLALVLHGYERSDPATRNISNRALLQLDTILGVIHPPEAFVDQLWLGLAAQQVVILEHVEADLEALLQSGEEHNRTRQTLGRLHQLLRQKAHQTMKKVGIPLVAEPGIALFVS